MSGKSKQLSLFEVEEDHIREDPKKVDKPYFNAMGEPLPWEIEDAR